MFGLANAKRNNLKHSNREYDIRRMSQLRLLNTAWHQPIGIRGGKKPGIECVFQPCWHLGERQGDIANLIGERRGLAKRHRQFYAQENRGAGVSSPGHEFPNGIRVSP